MTIAEIIHQHIAVHLGPHTAKMAIKMAAGKSVGLAPDAVRLSDVPKVIEELHPMLNVLIGGTERSRRSTRSRAPAAPDSATGGKTTLYC